MSSPPVKSSPKSPKPQDNADAPGTVHLRPFLARFGTFMLNATDPPKKSELMPTILKALEADNRVAELLVKEYRPDWIGRYKIFATLRDGSLDEESLTGIKFSDPISFKIHVPIKNQQPFRGHDDIPSDDYWVAWDGVTMVTLWPHVGEDYDFPRSGGHIAIEILRDVVQKVGFGLHEQPCSPNCKNGFTHTTLVIHTNNDNGDGDSIEANPDKILYRENGSFVDVFVNAPPTPAEIVQKLAEDFKYEADVFARYKNSARRIRDVEEDARDMVTELLDANFHQISRARLSTWMKIRTWRDGATARRRSLELIALLWLALAHLESVKRDWLELRRRLDDAVTNYGTAPLFAQDRVDDDGFITSLDVTFIKAAVEQHAARLDSRVIAWATASGAIAAMLGAIAGAIATTLAG